MTNRSDRTEQLSGADAFAEKRYVWVFQCSCRLAMHAASLDRNGSNLPTHACAGGRWIVIGQIVVGPEREGHVFVEIEALKRGIEQHGYYLWSAEAEMLPRSFRLVR